jgi:hypothetical protein
MILFAPALGSDKIPNKPVDSCKQEGGPCGARAQQPIENSQFKQSQCLAGIHSDRVLWLISPATLQTITLLSL